jgi:hypothetical protein
MSSHEQDFVEVMQQGAAAGLSSADAEEVMRLVDALEHETREEVGHQQRVDCGETEVRHVVRVAPELKAERQ